MEIRMDFPQTAQIVIHPGAGKGLLTQSPVLFPNR